MRKSLMTLALAAALALPAALGAPPLVRAAEIHQATSLMAPAPPEARTVQTAGYAQREAQAKDLECFTGGHDEVVIVGCGALVLVVLILVLI